MRQIHEAHALRHYAELLEERERCRRMLRWLAVLMVVWLVGGVAFAATCTSGQQPFRYSNPYDASSFSDGVSASAACAGMGRPGTAGYFDSASYAGSVCTGVYGSTSVVLPGGSVCEPSAEPPATPASGTAISCGAACSITVALKPEQPSSAERQAQIAASMDLFWLLLGVVVIVLMLQALYSPFRMNHEV